MSTYPQYTLKSADVYNFTIHTLDTLPLTMPGAIQSRDLWRVLVFAAAAKLSVHHACQQLERAPSGPTVLGTLAQQLSDLDGLEGHANDLLARLLPKGLGKRGRCVAIDLIALPYHGTVEETPHDEVCRSTATCGTPHFFTYATAYAVVRGRRSTLALCRVRAKQTMDHVVRTLLERLVMLGIRLKLLLLDRGFYSVQVMRDLIMGELPFIMPAVKRSKKPTTPGGPGAGGVSGQPRARPKARTHATHAWPAPRRRKEGAVGCKAPGIIRLGRGWRSGVRLGPPQRSGALRLLTPQEGMPAAFPGNGGDIGTVPLKAMECENLCPPI
jgi:hypothetical protein